MKSILSIAIGLSLLHTANAQFHINTGSTITITNEELLFTNDSISGGGSIDATDGTLKLGANASMSYRNDLFTSNEVKNFTLVSGVDFTLNNSQDVTITQDLTLDGNIIVNNTGALIQSTGSTLSGTGTVEVHKSGFPAGPAPFKYNYFASPTTNSNVNLLGNYRYYYDPSIVTTAVVQGWVPYYSGIMTPGRAYIATNSGDVVFTGTPNNGTILYSAFDKTLGASSKLMNVIGNPYPSGLDLNAFVTANPAITGVIYFWDDNGSEGSNYTNNGYATWSQAAGGTWVQSSDGGNKITSGHNQAAAATCQGFAVLPTSANPAGSFNIEFNNSMRIANGAIFFKPQNVQRFYINLLDDTVFLSQCAVVFDSDATPGYDERLDAQRIAKTNSPLVNTKINQSEYAIASYPNTFDSTLVIPLSVWVPHAQTYSLSIPKLENLTDANLFWLNDSTGVLTPIADSNNVFIEPLQQGNNNHLYIAIKPKQETATTLIESTTNQPFDAFTTPTQLVLVNAPAENSTLQLFNAAGQLVDTQTIQQAYTYKSIAKGLYVARIQSANSIIAKKIIVQ